MMEVVAALAALKMPVVLAIYAAAGYASYGGGPAMHPMPSMAACESTGARIARDLSRQMPVGVSGRSARVFFTCQEIRP
jgi:hypothetical protein